MSSPTQRTLAWLRAEGYFAEVVERWNPHARIRQDFAQIVDVIGLREGETLGVQCTSGSNVAARVAKIADHPNTPILRSAGWRLLVQGWRKDAAGRWVHREVDVS